MRKFLTKWKRDSEAFVIRWEKEVEERMLGPSEA
jgi:hypothetical protein